MLHSHEGSRPDGLIVTDDHLVEPLADVLVGMGVRVPDDLAVVGHWNYPLKYERDLPIQRLGWDAVELLDRWMDTIDAQRRGESVPSRSSIAPRLEHQLITANSIENQSFLSVEA
jgi:DNA-binding LacI/PurR family transcriptional regulator